MNTKRNRLFTFVLLMIFTIASGVLMLPDADCVAADPPPVRQNLGFPDSSIADLTEEDCRFCHEDPNIVDDAHIPDRHHLLVGTTVPDPTVRPFPDGDTNGNYDCYSCHDLVWDPNSMTYQFETFRDCIFCHNTGSPHHHTADALAQNCDACHGLVDNPSDGHFIPEYPASLVTPKPSDGEGLPLNSRNNGAGACDYCHDSGLTEEGIMADNNQNLHHNTNLTTLSPPVCQWCHDFSLPPEERIRGCEGCHGINTLHNIQVDSTAPGNIGSIEPGFEDPYFGHIGNNDDCWGCHGFTSVSAPGSGPIIPDISLLSAYSIPAGTDTSITISGSALTNTVQTPQGPVSIESNVVLTAVDGTTTAITPDAITVNSMEVTIPGTLAAGNYILRAVKLSNDSNAVNIALTPPVTITDAYCDKKKGVLTVNGSGFSVKPEGTDADISVEVNGQLVDIISWIDTKIKVSVSSCIRNATIKVKALFGTAVSGAVGKPPKPCKGKKC